MQLVNFLILAALFVLSGFFAGAETAIFSLSKIERRRLSDTNPRLARWVLKHIEHPRRALATILIANLLVNTLAASFATLLALEIWGKDSLGIAMPVFTIFFIFFGDISPKMVAVTKNETIALFSAFALEIIAVLLYPLRKIMRGVSDAILSLLIHEKGEHYSDLLSEAELKALIKIGEEEGVLDRQERYMIQKIFELGERPVKAIMTPRTDLVAVDVEDPLEKQLEVIKKYHFSHLPVIQGSKDNILGVIPVQEFMLSPERKIQAHLKQPLFVPETKRIDELLVEFRRRNEQFSVCVDEFGGTAGIVTQEDILEEIFGEFYDEYAKVEHPIRPLGHGEFIIEAKIPLAAFNEFFSSQLKAKEATTLGGFILEKMGVVPEKGKVLHEPDFEIRVHDVIRQRIKSVIVRPRV